MKKFFLCLSALLLASLLALGVFAAETVIYENDFSDPSTLSDFKQYCMQWEIKDGALRLTEDTQVWSHIIYQSDKDLTNYIVEVDYMNVQTAGGIVFNVDQDKVDEQQNGFYGLVAFLANDADKGALGSTTDTGAWKGNIKVGAKTTNISANIHIKVTVSGGKAHILMTDIDSKKIVFEYNYTLGSNDNDQGWKSGTVGLRMRSNNAATFANSVDNAYFDNFKITDLGDSAGTATGTTTTTTPAAGTAPQLSLTELYRNTFDSASALKDFSQFRGTWEVKDGRLYLTEQTEGAHSYILYAGDKSLTGLTDYVLDVDMYNIQTQGGAIVRSDIANVTGDTDDGFMGYMGFVSNDGTKGAIGTMEAKWNNLKVGPAIMKPGADIHMQMVVQGKEIQLTITELATGNLLWTTKVTNSLWTKGSFGFRLRGKATNAGLNNLNTTSFDNLVISTINKVETPVVKPSTLTDYHASEITSPADPFDTSAAVEVYRNTFDDTSALADFAQFRGTWNVHDGKLYLSAATATQSYILYEGDKALTELTDYVLDVDMYNVQTQGGAIVRSDIANVTGETDDGIMGYMGFVANNGDKGALGAGAPNGKWVDGNIEVGPAVMKPGANIHLQMAVKGKVVQLTITDIATGAELWKHAETVELWDKGSFGFRLRGKATNAGLDNINTTYFDNLVISAFPADATEVKLQIGNKTGYVNGVAKELDAAPVIKNSRTMLPIRFVAEALGAVVGWDGATSSVTVTTDTTKLELKVGAATAKINGVEKTLDAPSFIENSRTYLPVRFVAEALGAKVDWDGATSTATLTK